MFKFEYVKEEDVRDRDYVLLLPGKCDFEILDVYEQNKKTGQPYKYTDKTGKLHQALMVKFLVIDREKRKEYVYDYISHWKLRQLMTSCNLLKAYTTAGCLDINILRKRVGCCEIDHEEKPPYNKKNIIIKYLKLDEDEEMLMQNNKSQQENQAQSDDDDLPF